jgi:hypothetical protein
MTSFYSDLNIYDEDTCYEPLDYIGDKDLFVTRLLMGAPAPVQLAPKHCDCSNCKWLGKDKQCEQKYLTVNDMQKYFAEQVRIQRENAETETIKAMSKMQKSFIERMKDSDENTKNKLSRHYEFMRSLPKESSSVRARKEIEKNKIFMKKMKAQQKFALKMASNVKKTTPATKIVRKSFDKQNIEVQNIEVQEIIEEFQSPTVVEVPGVIEEVESPTVVEIEEVKTPTVFEIEEVKTPTVEVKLPENWQEVKKKTSEKSHNKTNLTQMCNSVFTGEECLYKEHCRFAHSKSELVVFDCPFGSNCHYVNNKSNGVYTSVEGKWCKNKHPGETKDALCSRIFKKKMFSEKNQNVSKTLMVCQDKPILALNPKTESKVNSFEEVVLLVPEKMALQALEIMINSGKTNITIKLI